MKRILAVKLRPLGDAVLAGNCFEALRKTFPKAWITALLQPPAHELYKKSGWVNEVIAYHRGAVDRLPFWEKFRKQARLVSALRARKFDLALDLSASHRSAQIIAWSKPGLRVGLGLPRLRRFYDLSAPSDDELEVSAPELDRRVMGLIGIVPQGHDREGGVWPVPPEASRFADQFWRDKGFKENEKVIAINPFASCRTKEWYPEKWKEVLGELPSLGARAFFTCAPLEKPGLAAIEKDPVFYAGRELTPLLGLYRKSALVLSVDSGPRHLAAGVGTPTLTVWGPEPVHRWHPYSSDRHPIVLKEVPCRPCGLAVCVEKKHECMAALGSADVVRALRPLLEGSRP